MYIVIDLHANSLFDIYQQKLNIADIYFLVLVDTKSDLSFNFSSNLYMTGLFML